MANMTGTTMANWLPEVWSHLATITYRSNVVLDPLMDHRWEPEIGPGRGDTVNIPNFTQNTSANKRSTFGTGASVTFDAVTESQTQLLIDQLAYKAFRMPVEMALQSMTPYQQLLVDGIGQAVALKVDAELASDDTNGIDALTAIGLDNEDVNDDVILEGETVLNDNNAKVEDRFFVVSPATRASLMQNEVIRNQLYGGTVGNLPGNRGAGFLGSVYTLNVYMSNNLESGTAGKKNGMFQRECIAFASQQDIKFEQDLNIEDGLFNQFIGYKVYGFKLVKSSHGREVAGR